MTGLKATTISVSGSCGEKVVAKCFQTQWFGSGLQRSSDVGVWPIYYRSSVAAAAAPAAPLLSTTDDKGPF
jgi:hypothetical protein